MKLPHSTSTALAAFLAAAGIAGCSPIRGYCAAAADCSDFEAILLDPVGESNDSIEVCVVNSEGLLRALRANEEDGCFQEAAATELYFACVADTFAKDEKDACDGFVFDDQRNPCFSELDDVIDLRSDNSDNGNNNCSSREE